MQIYKSILLIAIFLIWFFMALSRYEKYDTNYALALLALLISFAVSFGIAFCGYFNWKIVKSNANLTIFFFATSSPISLYMFVYSFEEVFGQFFYHPH